MAHDTAPQDQRSTSEHGDTRRSAASPSRRRLLKRTLVGGVPVVLASVKGRNAWAQTSGSLSPSLTGSQSLK